MLAMRTKAKTEAELIVELGGGTKVAQLLKEATGREIDRETVYKWRERNFVAWPWRGAFAELCRSKKLQFDTEAA